LDFSALVFMMCSNSGKELASSGADLCEVVFPYQGLNKDELTLRVGQVVTIINKDVEDAGWWKGELDGVVGVFPENFVKVIEKKSSDKKPERPPAMLSSNTTVKVDDTEKAKKLTKSISVEEKYDLDSLRKELTENMVAKSRPGVASKPDEIIPAINIMNVKKREKGKSKQLA
jgi:SH3 domain-containing kinase-binding protein 1